MLSKTDVDANYCLRNKNILLAAALDNLCLVGGVGSGVKWVYTAPVADIALTKRDYICTETPYQSDKARRRTAVLRVYIRRIQLRFLKAIFNLSCGCVPASHRSVLFTSSMFDGMQQLCTEIAQQINDVISQSFVRCHCPRRRNYVSIIFRIVHRSINVTCDCVMHGPRGVQQK